MSVFMRKYAAEMFGTYVLVFCGTGAIVADHWSGGAVSHPGIAATFGLVVLALVYALGDVSGAHLNPAVSIGFWAAGRFPARQLLPYTGSQLAGALLASYSLKLMFPGDATLGATLPTGPVMQSFFMEFFLTLFLMYVILSVSSGAKEKGIMAGIAIGATVGLEAMFAGPVSGASMNPARSIGPAIASGNLQHLWLYIAAPLAGAALAVGLYKIIEKPISDPE